MELLDRIDQFAFVLGNSWQLQQLSPDQCAKLNNEDWVFCCNLFMSHCHEIDIKPTVWVYGDTFIGNRNASLTNKIPSKVILYDNFKRELEAIQNNPHRLKHIFICLESEEAKEILSEYDLQVPVTIYKRCKDWLQKDQKPATSLDQEFYHYGSTLTDAVNLAHVVTGRTVKITGCQYMTRWGHWYGEDGSAERYMPFNQSGMVNHLWVGLSELRDYGIPMLDCNLEHGKPVPEKLCLRIGTLFN